MVLEEEEVVVEVIHIEVILIEEVIRTEVVRVKDHGSHLIMIIMKSIIT